MSSTIFPSLTIFFSRGGHHLSPHPTIFPQPTIPHTQSIYHGVNFITRASITRYKLKGGVGLFFLSRVELFHHALYEDRPMWPNNFFTPKYHLTLKFVLTES
ncbi:hypothetical protein Hanom_Chr06g00561901 [Helianthus anomalus]